MNENTYLNRISRHFLVIAAAVGATAGLAKTWENAPWWAYCVILLLAPATAGVAYLASWARRKWVIRQRDQLRFPQGTVKQLAQAITDLLGSLRKEKSGLAVSVYDAARLPGWSDTLLTCLHGTLKKATDTFPADAYVVWLKADVTGERIAASTACGAPADFASKHIAFEKGDGLAGKVWESGQAALHSAGRPNADWQTRPGCNNASYVCVPVGRPCGPGGVLGFGSDTGFEVNNAQIAVMQVFAAVLAIAAEAKPREQNRAATS